MKKIENWDNIEVKSGVKIENSIILPNITVSNSVKDEIISCDKRGILV